MIKSMTPENPESIINYCINIQKLDSAIRFVGIANRMGTLLATYYRENLKPLMNIEETKIYSLQAVLRAELREDFQKNIGRLIYSVGKYEKIIRATIPINKSENNQFYLLVTFDITTNAIDLIENRIIPHIKNNSVTF